MIDPTLTGPLMEAAKEPLANITNPPTRSIGRFFGDTLDFWFSNRELKYAKKQIMDEIALRKFREECEAEFAKIPEEELVPPRKALLLPALDAAEYYVEEEELRCMFARLVAATCDMRKASKMHPSFAQIIQELSPKDAENLMYLHKNKNCAPIISDIINGIDAVRFYPYFITDPDLWDDEYEGALQTISVISLVRLGLVSIHTPTNLAAGYNVSFEIYEKRISDLTKEYIDTPGYPGYIIRKSIIEATALGADFCEICLPPPLQEEDK